MTLIDITEIETGLVAFLDQAELAADSRVCHTVDLPEYGSRPFVCLASDAENSTWTPVTTEQRLAPQTASVACAMKEGSAPSSRSYHDFAVS